MHIENKGNMRIITPDFGYVIYNKKADSYSSKVYLGINASLDDFTEVIDESMPKAIREKVLEVSEEVRNATEINNTQDEILNISMLATDEINTEYNSLVDDILIAMDELFCMIEPILNKEEGGIL